MNNWKETFLNNINIHQNKEKHGKSFNILENKVKKTIYIAIIGILSLPVIWTLDKTIKKEFTNYNSKIIKIIETDNTPNIWKENLNIIYNIDNTISWQWKTVYNSNTFYKEIQIDTKPAIILNPVKIIEESKRINISNINLIAKYVFDNKAWSVNFDNYVNENRLEFDNKKSEAIWLYNSLSKTISQLKFYEWMSDNEFRDNLERLIILYYNIQWEYTSDNDNYSYSQKILKDILGKTVSNLEKIKFPLNVKEDFYTITNIRKLKLITAYLVYVSKKENTEINNNEYIMKFTLLTNNLISSIIKFKEFFNHDNEWKYNIWEIREIVKLNDIQASNILNISTMDMK